jgi:hypothetical protein
VIVDGDRRKERENSQAYSKRERGSPPNDPAKCPAIELVMKWDGKRYLATPHYDMTAALPYAFEAVFR